MQTITAYIGIGANLGDPEANIHRAFSQIIENEKISDAKLSPLYWNPAIGPDGQPDYLNGVIQLVTSLSAEQLLDELQTIENQLGRERLVRWGARTIDLDILLYGNTIIATSRLTVPHRELGNRAFVIQPLCDLSPDLTIPGGDPIARQLQSLDTSELTLAK